MHKATFITWQVIALDLMKKVVFTREIIVLMFRLPYYVNTRTVFFLYVCIVFLIVGQEDTNQNEIFL